MRSESSPVVETTGLVKKFGRTTALAGLDLSVLPGEVHGFLGPNGAGKSTTLRILLGLIRPTSGNASVFGLDPWAEPAKVHRDVAYVPGDVSLWPNLSGGQVIDLLTGLRGGADERLLGAILHGDEGGPFADFAALYGEWLGVERRNINFSDGNTPTASVDGHINLAIEPLPGPGGGVTTVKNAMFGFAPEFLIGKGQGGSDLFGLDYRSVYAESADYAFASEMAEGGSKGRV